MLSNKPTRHRLGSNKPSLYRTQGGSDRLDEVPGIGVRAAQVIIAEIGLDMAQFPTAGDLVSWAKVAPRTVQSGPKTRSGKAEKGNRYLKGILAEVATGAAKTDTFLGERYRRLVRRRVKQRALVAVFSFHFGHSLAPARGPDSPLCRSRP
jgi:transposase